MIGDNVARIAEDELHHALRLRVYNLLELFTADVAVGVQDRVVCLAAEDGLEAVRKRTNIGNGAV